MVYGMYFSAGFLLVPVDPAVFRCEAQRLLGDVRPPPHHHRPPLLLLDLQPHQVHTNYSSVLAITKLSRCGALVLIVHDFADAFLEAAKLFHYAK